MRNLLLKNFYKLKRNPSNVQVLLLTIIVILIIYILFGNQIISTAKNNLETTLKNRNEREFSGDIDVGAWQYSWIRTGIINMKNAQGPAQWRAINWEKGCFSRRITKWNEIYQNTIQDSCEKLNIIQKDYDNYCLGINENCEIEPDHQYYSERCINYKETLDAFYIANVFITIMISLIACIVCLYFRETGLVELEYFHVILVE